MAILLGKEGTADQPSEEYLLGGKGVRDRDELVALKAVPLRKRRVEADALAREAEAIADLFQGHRLVAVQTETHAQHGRVARIQLVEEAADLGHLVGRAEYLVRRLRAAVRQHLLKRLARLFVFELLCG